MSYIFDPNTPEFLELEQELREANMWWTIKRRGPEHGFFVQRVVEYRRPSSMPREPVNIYEHEYFEATVSSFAISGTHDSKKVVSNSIIQALRQAFEERLFAPLEDLSL